MLVVGDQEADSDAVAVRALGGEDLGRMSLPEFAALLKRAVTERQGRLQED
jgi:threonyl-tRNA synthetase